jgi:SEC-C motif
MGALADGFAAFAQPLLDQTDGSWEQVERAFALSQICYNLALTPEDNRESMLSELRPSLNMRDDEFDEFRHGLVEPMIRRHQEMFPFLHGPVSTDLSQSIPTIRAEPKMAKPGEKYPGTDRYAPCPCNSGEKFKFCCGAKGR